jgi:processive 1,2-diacylglycerol beta-glucosyltransferase
MKKLVTVLLCAFVVGFCALLYRNQSIKRPFWGLKRESLSFVQPAVLIPKKKIIIFTSSGGFGHQAATKALTEYLGDRYELQPVYVIQDVLGSLDFVHMFTFGHFYAEQFYNYCLVHHHIGWVNFIVWCGLWVFKYRHNAIKQLIKDYLYEQNPDMVISVTTVVNGATLDAAQELDIPFWVIPTDLDASMFITQIEAPTYKKFFFNSAYNLSSLKVHSTPAKIPESQMTYSGFPVRKSFLRSYDRNALKQEYAIPLGKPVLMLMLGGLGAHNTITYAQELSRLTKPVHCLICIGKNEALRPKLEEILNKTHTITYTVIGFTHDIAPLMAMADLLITKSGGASINEGLYMGVPMIIDGSTRAPQWEYYNRSFIAEHGCGLVLKHVRHLRRTIERLLANPIQLQAMKHAIQRIPRINPEQAMPKFVASLLG